MEEQVKQEESYEVSELEESLGALPIAVEDAEEVEPLGEGEAIALLEALIFAVHEPIAVGRLSELAGISERETLDALEAIQMKFEHEESGIALCCVAGKYQFRTKGRFGSFIREMRAGRPKKLSGQALETLAIVAYRQPIVKSDIEKIRGVDATPTIKTLLERRLIKIVGHQASVGQPALYGTTDEFLKLFGLESLGELPSLREIKELDADPGEPGEDCSEIEVTQEGEEEGDSAVAQNA